MFILDFEGSIRTILVSIDSIAYDLIDNMYNLIKDFARAEIFNSESIIKMRESLYIIISIFALFRLAVLLINSIISPDKMEDKENGLSAIFRNFVIMFVILAIAPFAFRELHDLQTTIVEGNYIQRLFMERDNNGDIITDENGNYVIKNPGEEIKRVVIEAMIHPDDRLARKNDAGSYEWIDENVCTTSNKCQQAIEDYNNNILEGNGDLWLTIKSHIGNYTKNSDDKIYVYHYYMIVTFVVGIAITYLLLTFALEIAIRLVKLGVLELLSPLFIVTYADPKMAKSGPFHNWLSEYGKAYAGLFIRLAVLAILILLIGQISPIMDSMKSTSGVIAKLILLFAILIFAKQLPGWISGLIGLKDDGLKGGGFFKKLGEAALIGGMVKKAMDSGKSKSQEALKRHAGNVRDRGLKRAGAFRGSLGTSKEKNPFKKLSGAHKVASGKSKNLKAMQKANAPMSEWRKNYEAAKKEVNPEYKSARDKRIEKLEGKANAKLEAAINAEALLSASKINELKDELKKQEKAKAYTADGKVPTGENGERLKIEFADGKGQTRTFKYPPSSDKEINEAIGYADSKDDAFENYGRAVAQQKGIDTSSMTHEQLRELGKSSMSEAGRAKVEAMVAKNVATNLSNYQQVIQQTQSLATNVAQQNQQIKTTLEAVATMSGGGDVVAAAQAYQVELQKADAMRKDIYELETDKRNGVEIDESKLAKLKTDLNSMFAKDGSVTVAAKDLQEKESKAGVAVSSSIKSASDTQNQLNQYAAEQKQYEKMFTTAKEIVYDEKGKPTGETKNPYEQTVEGVKYNPVEGGSPNYAHLSGIIASAQQEQTKKEGIAEGLLDKGSSSGDSKGDGK